MIHHLLHPGFTNCRIGACCIGTGATAGWSARAELPPPGSTLHSMYTTAPNFTTKMQPYSMRRYISFWKQNTLCFDKQDNQIPVFIKAQDITDSSSQKALAECRVLSSLEKQGHYLQSETQALSESLDVVYTSTPNFTTKILSYSMHSYMQICLQPRIAAGFYHTCAIRGQRLLPSGAIDTNDASSGICLHPHVYACTHMYMPVHTRHAAVGC
jgi:hypothetical protein